jgi:2-C-methyl-D-erythritol 4-phosphate cytidylyltransferase
MQQFAIIVAGGSGTRMNASLPKQFHEIGGRPVLMHTLQVFFDSVPDIQLYLVLPENEHSRWAELCSKYAFDLPHVIVAGGNSRFQSVKNGLQAIGGEEGVVAIHDGVRPFVAASVIRQSFEVAAVSGSAIAVITLKDSLRKVDQDSRSHFLDRSQFRLVQTPQTFDLNRIKKAFEVEELAAFTDDATVYEFQGWQVSLIEGNPENIKITTPDDLAFADFIFLRQQR